jgi:aldose sugar dehydrogenase
MGFRLAALALFGCVLSSTLVLGQRRQSDPGAQTFATYCAGCHGSSITGGRAPTLFDDQWHFGGDDASIRQSITEGRAGTEMPPFKSMLKDDDITALIAFIRAQAVASKTTIARAENPAGKVLRTEKHTLKIEMVADGLETPWGMAFLPDGRMLVTERSGKLRVIDRGKLLPQAIEGTPAVWAHQDGGMLDVAVHPEYARAGNGWIYLSYAEPGENDTSMTAIVRGRIKDGKWIDQQVLYHAPKALFYPSNVHYGSRFLFDKQGHLFYSIGERGHEMEAQDLSSPLGKLHRINDDGSVPKDDPFVGRDKAIPTIWSYGHRHPQGLAFHPVTGKLWETEHGPTGGDELNRIEPGRNYGWPVITSGKMFRAPGDPNANAPEPPSSKEGMESPIVNWTPTIAPSGITFYTGKQFPDWNNHLFVTGLAGEALRRLETDGDTVVHEEVIFKGYGRVRAVVVGPDGYLYVALNVPGVRLSDPMPGSIVRLVPVPASSNGV